MISNLVLVSLIWIFLPLIVILTKNIYFNETFSSMEQVRCFFFCTFHTVISPLLKGIIFLWNINHISIIKRIGRLISPLLRDNIDCGYRIFSCQYSQVTRITMGLSLKHWTTHINLLFHCRSRYYCLINQLPLWIFKKVLQLL